MGFPPGVAQSMVYQHFMKYQKEHEKKFPPKDGLEERWKKYQEGQQKAAEEAKQKKEEEDKLRAEGKLPEKAEEPKPKEEVKKPAPAPAPKPKVDPKMQEISTYNGDTTDKYSWAQTHSDLTVQIKVPEGTKARELIVVMKPQYLSVAIKGQEEKLVEGDLFEKIKVEDSFWNLEDNKYLVLTLEKQSEVIWKTIITGDQEIDPKKVDNAKKMEEFDEET